MTWLAVLAATLGVVPLLWLAGLHRRGMVRPAAWWWMAGGFAVSFLADVAGVFGYHALAAQVYPVSQAALFALALLGPSSGFGGYVALLLASASLSIMWRGAGGYDVILRAVSWGGVAVLGGMFVEAPVLRWTLAVGFGAMFLAWFCFTLDPSFANWSLLQAARLGTTVGFCVAARRG